MLRQSARQAPNLIAHRGSNRRALENTLKAFELAIEEQADGVELDVRCCASGEAVVIHDADLLRVGQDARNVADLSWSELKNIQLKDGQPVPLLEDALDLLLREDMLVNVELKADRGQRRRVCAAVRAVLLRLGGNQQAKLLVSSFDAYMLSKIAATESVSVGYLFDAQYAGLLRARMALASGRVHALHPYHRLVTADLCKSAHAKGLAINAWTVNEPIRIKELARMGVDGIITDDVALARNTLL